MVRKSRFQEPWRLSIKENLATKTHCITPYIIRDNKLIKCFLNTLKGLVQPLTFYVFYSVLLYIS